MSQLAQLAGTRSHLAGRYAQSLRDFIPALAWGGSWMSVSSICVVKIRRFGRALCRLGRGPLGSSPRLRSRRTWPRMAEQVSPSNVVICSLLCPFR